MQFRFSPTFSHSLLAALIATSFCGPGFSAATDSEVQWKKPRYRTTLNNTKLTTVLKRFAEAEHLHLHLASGVMGRVSGSFDSSPEKLLDTLGAQYNFSWRLDGKRFSIAPLESVAVTALPLNDPLGGGGGVALRVSKTTQTLSDGTVMPVAANDPAISPLKVWSTTPADKTLQNALARWASVAGWQLFWELPQDYSVEAAASINGSFEDAVTAVTNSLQQNDVPVSAIFFEGNRVLRIVARGAQ